MARKSVTTPSSGSTILLVDDNADYLEATRRLLEREGHHVLTATNGQEALAVLRQKRVNLVLLDYFMPGMTGEEVVKQLRQFDPLVQVILQTGYASEHPPREMLRRLDIQGYFDKSEGPDKLLLWTDAGLKAAYTVQLLHKSRQGLRYILDVTPEMHKIQPLNDLLQGILLQVAGLLGAVNSFLAVMPEGGVFRSASGETEGFVAMIEEETELVIHASTGRFASHTKLDQFLDPEKLEEVRQTLQSGEIQATENVTIMPLRVGELTLGVIYLDRPIVLERDLELLSIFSNQAAVAIQNAQLYEMATLDPLTGVYVRRFFKKALIREIRTAFRSQTPLVLLMTDVDGLKRINDTAGHLAGDQALAIMGKVLRQATRSTDLAGRYGGDEFAIVLPQTRSEDAERVGQRILNFLQDQSVSGSNGDLPLRSSVGLSVLVPHTFAPADIPRPVPHAYFQAVAQAMIRQADEALYRAKQAGKNQICHGADTFWAPLNASALALLEAEAES